MPILLLREVSSQSLSTLVEKAQKQSLPPLLEYDIQLNNGHLELIPLSTTATRPTTITTTSKPERKITSTSTTDEGFDESDIDSLSLVSSDNDSFTTDKPLLMENDGGSKSNKTTTTETDSANGSSSSSDSDTEIVAETTKSPKAATFIDGNNNNNNENITTQTPKESYNLVDCVCYTDVKCTDILLFVIKNETFVFKFDNIQHLQTFYTNFTTLKAIANQKAYNKNFATKFNLLQRTDQNGVTHIEITREPSDQNRKTSAAKQNNDESSSSIISINTPETDVFGKYAKNKSPTTRDVNSRQRSESHYINDLKYNTINSKLGPKAKIITKSNSIENILDLDHSNSNLVITNQGRSNSNNNYLMRKVWNSAEDLLDDQAPKRPVRRKKGKAPAPPPPLVQEKQDVLSGQYVRVNVNFDPINDFDRSNSHSRLIIKSSLLNEPHPKKLQNFNNILSSAKPAAANLMTSFLKPKEKQILKYESRKLESIGTLNRNGKTTLPESNIWTNSVPRMLRKPRSKSETRNFVPMAYRYIDTTDYPTKMSYNNNNTNSKSSGHFPQKPSLIAYGHNLALSNYLRNNEGANHKNNQNINNRLFGLSPKLRDFNNADESRWVEQPTTTTVIVTKDNNLKSVIKNNGKDDNMMMNRKKNDKKVTFSAYTTVQVV